MKIKSLSSGQILCIDEGFVAFSIGTKDVRCSVKRFEDLLLDSFANSKMECEIPFDMSKSDFHNIYETE